MRAGRRWGSHATSNSADELAKRLPEELRNFDGWIYDDHGMPTGISDYLENLNIHLELQGVGPEQAVPVMQAAGLSVSSWYRTMLRRRPGGAPERPFRPLQRHT